MDYASNMNGLHISPKLQAKMKTTQYKYYSKPSNMSETHVTEDVRDGRIVGMSEH
jgi:hypothetical protein